MPYDTIFNDHYLDFVLKLNRKLHARYFCASFLKMYDSEEEMLDKINTKMIESLKSS